MKESLTTISLQQYYDLLEQAIKNATVNLPLSPKTKTNKLTDQTVQLIERRNQLERQKKKTVTTKIELAETRKLGIHKKRFKTMGI